MSKTLVITGMAQETDFDDPTKARTVLVINRGELRVPIDESSVEKILKYVLKDHVPDVYDGSQQNGHSENNVIKADPNEQVDWEKQAAGEEFDDDEESQEPPEPREEDVYDETGVSQL